MRQAFLVVILAAFLSPLAAVAADKMPAGTEEIVIDSMSKAKEATGKKVLKGPVPLKHQGHMDKGMACVCGRLRECKVFHWRFVALSHNTTRGAAGGGILNAELLYKKGYLG